MNIEDYLSLRAMFQKLFGYAAIHKWLFACLGIFFYACNGGSPALNSNKLDKVSITLSDESYAKLEQKKNEAIAIGILKKEDSDWVPASISTGQDTITTTLRLKGDWTDHLKSKKWSFRVQTDKKQVWNGMETFSLQHPKTRYYLSEWFYHEWLKRENVVATDYGFVQLELNNKDLGIYAYESHFDKILIANNARREGIIIKYNEDGFWDLRMKTFATGVNVEAYANSEKTSEIEPFDKARVFDDKALENQFEIASSLLAQWREGTKPVEAVFDLEKVASFLAICDINQAYHGLIWHNLRFYYNPVSSKLEPVGFDAFTEGGPFDWINAPFLGYGVNSTLLERKSFQTMWYSFFINPEFVALYHQKLLEYTSPDYINQLYEALDDQLSTYESVLQTEFKEYAFDRNKISERAAKIRAILYPKLDASPIAYVWKIPGNKHQYELYNHHPVMIEPFAIGDKKDRILLYLKDVPSLEAYNRNYVQEPYRFESNIDADWLFYKVAGIDSVFQVKMYEHVAPMENTPLQAIQQQNLESFSFLRVDGNQIFVQTGHHILTETLYLPKGHTVNISPNTSFDLTNGSGIVSEAPWVAIGNADEPILFYSSDQNNKGVIVLGEGEKSHLQHVYFDGMRTTDYGKWETTGSVTFNNTEVNLFNCQFKNNFSEDALNLIRSQVNVKNCTFFNTFADALDADFCSGWIQDCTFDSITNDGIDVSGSNVTIARCTITNCQDKAISVGEHSEASIYAITVNNAVTGIAAKDLSVAKCENINLTDCMFGFSAYQKKPEFGGANVFVNGYEATDVDEISSKDNESNIQLTEG